VALDRDKYRRLFIDEAREGLASISNELVDLERAARAGSAAPEALRAGFDAVFRHAHSMKGMGAAMGYARFASLAHRLEDVADLGRQGRPLAAAAWDLLLQGCDVLERCVDDVAAGADDPDPGDLAERVAAFLADEKRAALATPGAATPALPPKSDGSTARAGEVLVRVRIGGDVPMPQARALLVHKALSSWTTFVAVEPTPEQLRAGTSSFGERRELLVRFRRDVDIASAVATARALQGVVAVDVLAGPSTGREDPASSSSAAQAAAAAAATASAPVLAPTGPGPAASSRGDGLVGIRVTIAADATLPQVRAFVVHRALAAHRGWLETTPSPESLRQKELPDFAARRELLLRFQANADVGAIVAAARAAQGVANVAVVDLQPASPAVERERGTEERPRVVDDDRTIRVRTALLDDLIDSVGEVLLARSRLRALSTRLDHPELSDLVDEVDRLTRELHGRVVAARMTPLSFMAERLPRAVRDLARQHGKSVDFTMTGMDIELDRAILDELQAPLIHLLRNAVDHAHEGDAARTAKGRAPTMRLGLRAVRDRDRVLLELQDDGKGLDVETITKRAVERGLIDPARAATLSASAALDLICLPGFSTADTVTETSGRGVGMDVVKATVEKLGGVLRIASRRDHGTTMTLQLPLTVAIIQVLVVDVDGGHDGYAIPIGRVDRAFAVDDAAVTITGGRAWLTVGSRLVPLIDLGAALREPASGSVEGRRPSPLPPGGIAILVGAGRDEVALRVERIVGQEEVVAKAIGAPIGSSPFVAAGAILADGRAAYILEPSRLLPDDAAAASAGIG
jgi:two-component system chemotaxis sensor kinase CheA